MSIRIDLHDENITIADTTDDIMIGGSELKKKVLGKIVLISNEGGISISVNGDNDGETRETEKIG